MARGQNPPSTMRIRSRSASSTRVSTTSSVSMFFFSSRRRHTRSKRDWSSDVCSSDLNHRIKKYRAAVGELALPGLRLCRRNAAWIQRLHVEPGGHCRGLSFQRSLLHGRSEEHTSELQSRFDLVCRLLLEKKKKITFTH